MDDSKVFPETEGVHQLAATEIMYQGDYVVIEGEKCRRLKRSDLGSAIHHVGMALHSCDEGEVVRVADENSVFRIEKSEK